MANRAIGRKCCCHVARIGRVLEISLMTIDTGCTGQVVVVIGVARSARHAQVRAGQWKAG